MLNLKYRAMESVKLLKMAQVWSNQYINKECANVQWNPRANFFDKDKKYVWTFASYEEGDELFSDRNVFPKGCIIKMEKISEK